MHPLRLLVVTLLIVTVNLLFPGAAHASPAVQYTNPIAAQRADPHIFRHTDGYFYFTATAPEYDRIVLRRATTIQGLATAPETVIWRRHASGEMGAHIWAPEIHFINGKWYVYFAAGRADDVWRIRMYVLESSSANPLTGAWTERGRITTPWDTFSLDATTFAVNGVRYLLWAQQEPGIATNSNLYIARMGANPWTITGATTRLTVPALAWETRGYKVAEGPSVLQRNGRLFLTYSASATDANYCLGLLTAAATANPLQAGSWTKSPNPVFATNATTSQYGPGHNSFTVSEDGQSDLLVYHDRSYRDISGDPLNDPNRRTRVQKVYYRADGTPDFGIPIPDGLTPARLISYDTPGAAVRHWDFRARLETNVTPLADSQFRLVAGLSGSGTVSLESTNYPGYYLRHRNHEAWVQQRDGTTLFNADASFIRRTGLTGSGTISLESANFPGYFLRHRAGQVWVEQNDGSATFRNNASFTLE
ncbi:Beta-xylosidase, GH43 family [Nonomuraea solani]|uniref:Beta-xylosidase, GH43 family n=1 Tax=Nonomuraea solani TaxID=1144553 RepID=A0A1H6A2N8_9ACTN|nr:Beta-xylosidase, GH43 family [Nonomuraea solani]